MNPRVKAVKPNADYTLTLLVARMTEFLALTDTAGATARVLRWARGRGTRPALTPEQ